jgi:hypothetical protein
MTYKMTVGQVIGISSLRITIVPLARFDSTGLGTIFHYPEIIDVECDPIKLKINSGSADQISADHGHGLFTRSLDPFPFVIFSVLP